MAVGDGGNGQPHVALTAPSTGRVYVLYEFEQSNPPAPARPLGLPPGASAFGTGPLIFLDLDGPEIVEGVEQEGRDELIIGDPTASPDGVRGAGQVSVYRYSEGDDLYEFETSLHDSAPEEDQHYGRALGGTEFVVPGLDDTDLLLVGAQDETFTLFRSLLSGADPRP